MGFRSSKKNTPYTAQMAAQDCAKVAYDLGLRKIKVYIKGPGNGRESAICTIHGANIEVSEIIDVTGLCLMIESVCPVGRALFVVLKSVSRRHRPVVAGSVVRCAAAHGWSAGRRAG